MTPLRPRHSTSPQWTVMLFGVIVSLLNNEGGLEGAVENLQINIAVS